MSQPTPTPAPDSSGPPADARDRLRQLFEAHQKEAQALLDHNQRWLEETRPSFEAFFHARTMLELAVRYGRELGEPPRPMPSGWAALLYLFNLR